MHIVHYLKWLRLQDGGTVRAVLDLSAALARAGHTVTVLSADDSGVPESWRVTPTNTPTPNTPRSILLELTDPIDRLRNRPTIKATADTPTQRLTAASIARVRTILQTADALHLHGPWTPSNHALARLATSLSIPYVLSPHGMLDEWCMQQGALKKRIFLTLFANKTLRQATALHFTATAERTQAAKLLPESTIARSAVIPLVFDTSLFTNLPGPSEARAHFNLPTQPTFLFLSRIHHKKGIETLLRAAAKLLPQPFTLVIAGPAESPAYLASIKSLADQLNLTSRTLFPGIVSGPLKTSLYQSATAFVLPTNQENFGFVLIEALLAGTPVITTKGVDIWPELQSQAGATITNGSPAEVAQAMQSILDAPPTPASLASAQNWARQYVDEQSIVRQFELLYSPQVAAIPKDGPQSKPRSNKS